MDWNLEINNSWSGGQKKNLQKMLNTFGFTDGAGNTLKEDENETSAPQRVMKRMQFSLSARRGQAQALKKN